MTLGAAAIPAVAEVPSRLLAELDAQVVEALATDDRSALDILGYGEISCVLALDVDGQRYACKRLPPFSSRERLDAYRQCFGRYVERLAEHGVAAVPSVIEDVETPDGALIGWCIQPMLPAGSLLIDRLRGCDGAEALRLLDLVVARVTATIGPRLGLDSQLSNWALVGDELVYLDLTTPMMRDERGREAIDAGLFLASMPWLLRGFIRVFMLKSVIGTYYGRRSALVDLLGNVIKERLDHLLPALCERASAAVETPITEAEVRKYYRGDARLWEVLLRLRRMDRWWQRKVRRRPYPFLLPDGIAR